jgi:DNA-binding response OmpR family regulator
VRRPYHSDYGKEKCFAFDEKRALLSSVACGQKGRRPHHDFIVKEKTSRHSKSSSTQAGQVLVLEADERLVSAISAALQEAAPGAQVDIVRNLEEAQRLVLGAKPDLFVLDIDATYDLGHEFLYDLRTSHPNARAIILTGVQLAAQREQAAGLGAIHFLEKPFPHDDFVDLVEALLRPSSKADEEKFRGTLSDLHVSDIIQLKCMSRATAVLEFTGPRGEKARVFFEDGQVRHATASGKEGLAAFNEIVTWKGGTISEVVKAGRSPGTINQDWQVLLMEAMRTADERENASGLAHPRSKRSPGRKVLVIDDSLMLLSFVEEILTEANYRVVTTPTAEESLRASSDDPPDLILLDYLLPDMKGDEVSRKLLENPATADIPVVYMSGFGADLRPDHIANRNVIGFLNKPFTSDLLIKTVENHMPKSPGEPETIEAEIGPAPSEDLSQTEPAPVWEEETVSQETSAVAEAAIQSEAWWSAPPPPAEDWSQPAAIAPINEVELPDESVTGGAYFCGDTSFFSLNWALQTIAKEKLTGWLRSFWQNEPIDLLAHNGELILATTRDPELYCPEAPITLVNIDAEKIAEARAQQVATGCPLFLTLAREELILPAVQLVQHHGQKLFAQLWTGQRVRFMFEQNEELPDYATEMPAEPDVDHWALGSLRFIQFQELGEHANFDPALIPAYTKNGFDRVQNLKLTVAEAQFASQFNGSRSLQQIAKNLRLDLKFARLTLFRFLALEIVECWPPSSSAKPEGKGILQRFTHSIGLGE